MRVDCKGWKVWVWRMRVAQPEGPPIWTVYVVEWKERGGSPKGPLLDTLLVVAEADWTMLFGGEVADVSMEPTVVVLYGTIKKVES